MQIPSKFWLLLIRLESRRSVAEQQPSWPLKLQDLVGLVRMPGLGMARDPDLKMLPGCAARVLSVGDGAD